MTIHIQSQLVINRGHGSHITQYFSFFWFPLSDKNIKQKTSVDLKYHKASDSDSDLQDHKTLDSDQDSDLEDHKASDSYSNILIFCYGFRYTSANPVF